MDEGVGNRSWVIPRQRGGRYRCTWRLVLLALVTLSCSERTRSVRTAGEPWWQGGPPDDPPQMQNEQLPFRYPAAEFMRRAQGNVMLRLFVDDNGHVVPDSTRLEHTSGVTAFDSAALAGASRLRFRAARRQGVAISVALLFPVHFRHPEVPRAVGDTL